MVGVCDLFQTIQFSISSQFSCFGPIDRTVSGATTPAQSGPGSDGNEGALLIPQSSSITGTLPSDCSVLCTGYSLFSPSAEVQSVYSTVFDKYMSTVYSTNICLPMKNEILQSISELEHASVAFETIHWLLKAVDSKCFHNFHEVWTKYSLSWT